MDYTLLFKGIVIGISATLPFLIVASVKWYLWKSYCKFWHTRYRETQARLELIQVQCDKMTDRAYASAEENAMLHGIIKQKDNP